MSHRRYITTIGGTILCVLGIVYFTQAGQAPAGAVAPRPSVMPQAASAPSIGRALHEDPPADLGRVMRDDVAPGLAAPAPLPMPEPAEHAAQDRPDCAISVRVRPDTMATVDLQVAAPCLPGERLTVYHDGMIFSDKTDAAGAFAARVPALSKRAVYIVAFGNGKGAVATAQVADIDTVNRVVLQWNGRAGFELHAREFGAGYGEPGHLWFGADGKGAVGQFMRLGNPDIFNAKMADIYTFPTGQAPRAGAVALSVEAEVTANNCGREISAQTMELGDGKLRNPRDLTLSIPDCDALGSFLVLNNLFDDLKIAAN